jgi:nicotinate-nucleotide pyrophosphorylase
MSLDEMRQAVQITNHRAELEASRRVDQTTLRETDVDYIAIGRYQSH